MFCWVRAQLLWASQLKRWQFCFAGLWCLFWGPLWFLETKGLLSIYKPNGPCQISPLWKQGDNAPAVVIAAAHPNKGWGMCRGADRTSPFTSPVLCSPLMPSFGTWPAGRNKANWNVPSHFLFRVFLPSFLSADTKLQLAPPEIFHKHKRGKRAEQSNRDKQEQLNFFTYFSAPRVPALKSMNLLRANTRINDKKLFKVNVFKAAERKITLFVECFYFLLLTLPNVYLNHKDKQSTNEHCT